MAKLKIIQYPNSLLYRKAEKIHDFNSQKLQKTIDDMLETLYDTENCAALAATQLDIENPPSITVINHPAKPGDAICLLNPEIIKKVGKKTEVEGCMSIYPNLASAPVERAYEIHVKAHDRSGKEAEFVAEDYFAKVIQHELDHLDGIIYLSHLSPLKRARLEKKMQKMTKNVG